MRRTLGDSKTSRIAPLRGARASRLRCTDTIYRRPASGIEWSGQNPDLPPLSGCRASRPRCPDTTYRLPASGVMARDPKIPLSALIVPIFSSRRFAPVASHWQSSPNAHHRWTSRDSQTLSRVSQIFLLGAPRRVEFFDHLTFFILQRSDLRRA
ncbi:hypothetical protein B0H15DRAFT_656912 [Mycena belliarum]|uniref:Uncharacterized protein n=1 Tax=Mycena belliarum TaxID=1033014 RepID=A0AAD6XHI7_9AGAR|nr:hypothetical protein B0H15DRAFT_656912 [Mycena belliae]